MIVGELAPLGFDERAICEMTQPFASAVLHAAGLRRREQVEFLALAVGVRVG